MDVARRMAACYFEFAQWHTNVNAKEHNVSGVARGEIRLIERRRVRRGDDFGSIQGALLLFLQSLTPLGFEFFSYETWRQAIVLILTDYCALDLVSSHFKREAPTAYNRHFSPNDDAWASCLSEDTYNHYKRAASRRMGA